MKINAESTRPSGKPHAVLRGVEDALRLISGWPDVDSVVAGRISKVRHRYPALSVTVQAATVSGVKCLARTGQSVQEVFVVTRSPEAVAGRVRTEWSQ